MKLSIVLFSILLLCPFLKINGQIGSVGINREPTTALDVNGGVRLTSALYFGGADGVKGDAGGTDNVYAVSSQGDNKPPKWTPFKLSYPDYGNYFLFSSVRKNSSKAYIVPIEKKSGSKPYQANMTFSTASDYWVIFEELTYVVENAKGKILRFIFEVELGIGSDYDQVNSLQGWNSFSIGVAMDEPSDTDPSQKVLKSVRGGGCIGDSFPQNLFYAFFVLDDITITTDNPINFYIVGTYRNSNPEYTPSTGKGNAANLAFGCEPKEITDPTKPIIEAQSTLDRRPTVKIDVYEKFR